MHEDGEADVRGSYTALAVASLCNLLTDELVAGAADFIAACQTYEGGIGATPGEEAHGGYTFCGLAAMVLLGEVERLRVPQLVSWLVHKQMAVHGGFQGRTNKLVDGCYSFWQARGGPTKWRPVRFPSRGLGRAPSASPPPPPLAPPWARHLTPFLAPPHWHPHWHPHWQGGAFPLVQSALIARGDLPASGSESLMDTKGLLDYILICCQNPQGGG